MNRIRRMGSALIRQLEHVDRVAAVRMLDLRRDRARHQPRTAAAKPRAHRDVLLPAGCEAHRITRQRGAKPGLPQRLAGTDIERTERAIEIADEADAAGG